MEALTLLLLILKELSTQDTIEADNVKQLVTGWLERRGLSLHWSKGVQEYFVLLLDKKPEKGK